MIEQYKLSRLLKHYREKEGLTVRDIVKKMGRTSPNTYYQYESGERRVKVDKFNELMEYIKPGTKLEILVIDDINCWSVDEILQGAKDD